jgi:hypothetical protein
LAARSGSAEIAFALPAEDMPEKIIASRKKIRFYLQAHAEQLRSN